MKKIFSKLFLVGSLITLFASCKKDENMIKYEGGTNPVLTANRQGVLNIAFLTQGEEAVTLYWTNPDYKFTTGVSSQDVTYLVEIDTAGSNFSNPNRKSISISKDLSLKLTQKDVNDIILNQLGLSLGRSYNLEARVTSMLFNGNAKLTSNVMSFAATPYSIPPKVTPPGTAPTYADGHLFLVGSASPGGWNNPVPTPSQEFTRISATVYELTVQLNGGGSYLFLPINGFWGAKYGCLGSNNTNNPDGDDFKPEGGDMIAPAASGTYKIVVDFQRGKFTLTRQ